MALMYNPVTDNFVTYEAPEEPKVELNLPLMDEPIDISDWSLGFGTSGLPIMKPENDQGGRMIMDAQPSQSDQQIDIVPESDTSDNDTTSFKSGNVKDKEEYAYNFFINNGFSKQASAGIVGNLMLESSGLNTTIKGDGGKSIGIAQWNGIRRTDLMKFAKTKGKDFSDFKTQLEFILHELNSPQYKKALEGLLSATSVSEATRVFMDHYEKPGTPHFNKRLKYAQDLFKSVK